jgi:hypothetical protein
MCQRACHKCLQVLSSGGCTYLLHLNSTSTAIWILVSNQVISLISACVSLVISFSCAWDSFVLSFMSCCVWTLQSFRFVYPPLETPSSYPFSPLDVFVASPASRAICCSTLSTDVTSLSSWSPRLSSCSTLLFRASLFVPQTS